MISKCPRRISSRAGLRVVLAPAGHGKTALTANAAEAMTAAGQQVVALATTNKAVAELRAAGSRTMAPRPRLCHRRAPCHRAATKPRSRSRPRDIPSPQLRPRCKSDQILSRSAALSGTMCAPFLRSGGW
ncbi:MAG: AAA family ATPase [Acidimicrobiia bacterium]|nr:AAA family ATPase [Acidimicrobiia bacterium]